MKKSIVKLAGATAFMATTTVFQSPASAADYDMDCKVILCLVGGFPSGCSDAKSYMYKRLRKGKPPFGVCSLSDGGDYDSYNLSMNRLSGIGRYYCEPPNELHMRTYFSENRAGERTTHVGKNYCKSPSGGKSGTIKADWRFQVTVEPGTDVAYSSATYTVDVSKGQVYEGVGAQHISQTGSYGTDNIIDGGR